MPKPAEIEWVAQYLKEQDALRAVAQAPPRDLVVEFFGESGEEPVVDDAGRLVGWMWPDDPMMTLAYLLAGHVPKPPHVQHAEFVTPPPVDAPLPADPGDPPRR